MNLLIACHSIVHTAGSELYHFELCRELSKHIPNITLATQFDFSTETTYSKYYSLVNQLIKCGVKLTTLDKLSPNEKFDLIVASQPFVNNFLCSLYPTTPKISIIHSPYRSEDPIYHESIKHYIAVDVFILKYLKNEVGIPVNKIDLIFNGIDFDKFNIKHKRSLERTTGVFIGGWDDPLRNKMFNHISEFCNQNDWDLFVIGSPYPDNTKSPNIKFFTGIYNTEIFTSAADFTVGLGGRTTIEGWRFGIPSYIYTVNKHGDIMDVNLKYPPKMERFDIKNVAEQHIKLYKQIINENNI